LSALLPDSRLLLYYDKIIIINYFPGRVKYQRILDWIDKIKDLLMVNNAELGIAQPERTIDKLSRSYASALKAIHYGRRVRDHRITEAFDAKDINLYQGYDIFMYESYYIYHMIDLISNQNSLILENSYSIQALVWLHELDKTSKMDNVRLLYCYLANDGSASKTATQLHMHRNNVVYRISRIEEYLGMDLTESHLRFKVMFAYRVLDFYGIDYLENVELVLFGGTKSPQNRPDRKGDQE
jgi:DNA-binding PucR family transcriptional regulator